MYIDKWYSSNYKYSYLTDEVKSLISVIEDNNEPVIILREDNTLYNMITPDDLIYIKSIEGDKKIYEVFDPVEFFLFNDDTVEDAVVLMLENRVKMLPVVDSELNPLGLFGFFDVLKAFQGISAMNEPGTKVVMTLEDKPGKLMKIMELISNENINILSLLTHKLDDGKRVITLKLDVKNVYYISDLFEKENIEYETIFEEEL